MKALTDSRTRFSERHSADLKIGLHAPLEWIRTTVRRRAGGSDAEAGHLHDCNAGIADRGMGWQEIRSGQGGRDHDERGDAEKLGGEQIGGLVRRRERAVTVGLLVELQDMIGMTMVNISRQLTRGIVRIDHHRLVLITMPDMVKNHLIVLTGHHDDLTCRMVVGDRSQYGEAAQACCRPEIGQQAEPVDAFPVSSHFARIGSVWLPGTGDSEPNKVVMLGSINIWQSGYVINLQGREGQSGLLR